MGGAAAASSSSAAGAASPNGKHKADAAAGHHADKVCDKRCPSRFASRLNSFTRSSLRVLSLFQKVKH
jgi:hypothetical protein